MRCVFESNLANFYWQELLVNNWFYNQIKNNKEVDIVKLVTGASDFKILEKLDFVDLVVKKVHNCCLENEVVKHY